MVRKAVSLMKKSMNRSVLDTNDLPIVSDIYSLSDCIGLSPSLIFVLSCNSEKYYKEHTIPKRDGTKRIIYEPSYSMKLVQRWILEEILYKIPVSAYSYGFKKGLSNPLSLNANAHKDHLFVFKIDLKNFFPSISRDRVYYVFSNIGYNSTISNLFANICTLKNILPQGAVTSPYLSNLVSVQLDKRVSKYCDKRGIAFTRYADDLTFSTNDRSQLRNIYPMIKKIVEAEGFIINEAKTRFLTPKGRKVVTGITLSNGDLKAPKEMKRRVRAMIHKAIVTGDYSNIQVIRGCIAYISSIEFDYLSKVKEYIQAFANSHVCMFKESVDAFNENKFFKDITDFRLLSGDDIVECKYASEYESDSYDERNNYLQKVNASINMLPINDKEVRAREELLF